MKKIAKMKKILVLFGIILSGFFFNPAYAQVVVTATGSVVGPTTYTAVRNALFYLNSRTHQGLSVV